MITEPLLNNSPEVHTMPAASDGPFLPSLLGQ